MNYEIVTLPEKKAAGITARTNNHAPDMGSVIGGLWESFYAKGVYDSIPEFIQTTRAMRTAIMI